MNKQEVQMTKLSYTTNNPSFYKPLGKVKTNYKFNVGDKVIYKLNSKINILCTVTEVGVAFNQYKIQPVNPNQYVFGIASESELQEVQ